MGVRNRIVEAESLQSIGFSGDLSMDVPNIVSASSLFSMFAPKEEQASMVAIVSSENRGECIRDFPSDREAAITARCV
jgi:hypothetical protein